jgi:hypothetical protein
MPVRQTVTHAMPVDVTTFRAQRSPEFGNTNPTRMDRAFWSEMVRSGEIAYAARERFGPDDPSEHRPVWCFHRFGPTRTRLPDGRVVCIGGEHEDHYDPDFAIYNDVIVISPDGADVTIYGYPGAVFPPTDFHTATRVGNQILIIGGLGYAADRGGPVTPVFSLDLDTFAITRVTTAGVSPSWIFRHRARLTEGGRAVLVWGGELQPERGPGSAFVENKSAWELSLEEYTWRPATPPPDEPLPQVDWPDSWTPAATTSDRDYSLNLLLQQAPLGHPMFAAELRTVASSYWGRALFKLLDGSSRFVSVELSDCPLKHASLPDPATVYFDRLQDWLEAERARSNP